MQFRISQIWADSDDMREFSLVASSGDRSTSIEFYAYPDLLAKFGADLAAFEGRIGVEALLELGSPNEPAATWLRITAFTVDSLGHSALEICTNRNGARHYRAHAEFSSELEVAAINRLGQAIVNWAHAPELELDVSLPEA